MTLHTQTCCCLLMEQRQNTKLVCFNNLSLTRQSQPYFNSLSHQAESEMLQQSLTHQAESNILQQSLSHPSESEMLQQTLAHQTESDILQQSMSHQAESDMLQQSLSHQTDSNMLQQSMSQHTESSMLQATMSHAQSSEESLIPSEELHGMQLIAGDCNSVLQCDLSNSQTSLSVESMGHSSTQVRYNSASSNTISSLAPNSNLQCDLSVSSLSATLNPSSSQLTCDVSTPQVQVSACQNSSAQPTYITTTVPISSLLRPAFPPTSTYDSVSESRPAFSQPTMSAPLQPSPTVKPAILPNNILQQAISLNFPANFVAALASLPLLQSSGCSQVPATNSAAIPSQNVVPIAPAPPTSTIFQAIPTNIVNNQNILSSMNSTSSCGNSVALPFSPVLQRILPDTNKRPDTVTTASSNTPGTAVLSGATVYCAGTTQAPMDSALLPHIINTVSSTAAASVSLVHPHHALPCRITMVTSVVTPSTGAPSTSSQTMLPVGTQGVTVAPEVSDSPSQPTTGLALTSDHHQAASTFSSQFPMPVPVMSTQESTTLAASDMQSLQTCLSHPFIQSLSHHNLVTSLGNQIVFNPSRSQGTSSPSFPQLAPVDSHQMTQGHLLRQSGCQLPETDDQSSLIANSMSTHASAATGASTQVSGENYPVPPPSSLSPMMHLSNHFQTSGVLSNVALSPSDPASQNLTTRLYLTSPLTVVPLNHDPQGRDKGEGQEPAAPAFTLANMSVIDMLLKQPSDIPDMDRAALPPKETTEPKQAQDNTPKLSGLYCVECNNSYKNGCTYHKMNYTFVADQPVLPRARLTLPTCLILQTSHVKITADNVNNLGVFANEKILKKTEFGPLVGKIVSEDTYTYTSSFTWKIFYSDHHSVVDVSDEAECNWLMYVKPAPTLQDQNVVVYQRGAELYFVTNKDIEAGSEMLFWFAKDYAKLLGLPAKPSQLWPSNCPFCHVCSKVFSDWKSLSRHMKTDHPNSSSRRWPCQMCNRRFTSTTKLKTHMVALHMRLKPFSCSHCGKKFSDQSNLRQHLNIHTGERKFTCDICSKSFRQKAHLQSHMIIHTGGEGLQCRFCSAKIARPSDLKSHELKHTKEKCYPCALCVKVFYRLANYKKHMLVHNKERNFTCVECGKSFYSKYHLTRHLKSCKNAKLGETQGLGGSEENLFSTLDRDPQVEIDIVRDDNIIMNTTTGICARLRNQRQER
ncbi:mucin-6-like isoform X1 [Haliotis rubra]|uniref:mucin-6-like isoform X1 n=2 Tax=Haliotis rubra TaxID=36100 RepID=UPI001EE55D18|nr:mucin-6-like isoform X1 [Haliotis rubra]